jgi:hypothetical protein
VLRAAWAVTASLPNSDGLVSKTPHFGTECPIMFALLP